MIAYYEVTQDIRDLLEADVNINKVVTGLADKDDYNKTTIFPFANIIISGGEIERGAITFDVLVAVMDQVDYNKIEIRSEQDPFKGLNNKQDVLNTMLSVVENLDRGLRKNLRSKGYQINGNTTFDPFEDKFSKVVTGYLATINVTVINRVQNCG